MTGMGGPLRLERGGAIATITLHRPHAGNAIDVAMADALLAAALECDADEAVRCVVLTGSGTKFCTGGDVLGFQQAGDGAPALIERLTAPLHMAIGRMSRMNKPLITAINGAAAGAGFGLAIMGDVALAARSAKFAVAYGALGLSPDAATTWLLPRLVGLRQAQRLALAGETIDAPEALRIGLISEIVEDEDLTDAAMQSAEALAARSMGAIKRTRALLLSSFAQGLETHLEREAEAIASAARDSDGREGIAAFVERRKPRFLPG